MDEDSWRRNHGEGIMEVELLRGIIEETSGKHLGGIWEASGKHLGGIWEASGRHLGGWRLRRHLGSIWEASGGQIS